MAHCKMDEKFKHLVIKIISFITINLNCFNVLIVYFNDIKK